MDRPFRLFVVRFTQKKGFVVSCGVHENTMSKRTAICLIGVLFPFLLLAQGEAANWFFGNMAGVTFGDGSLPLPTLLAGGALNTPEGCSSISNVNGGLLFYSDGVRIFDRTHSQMPNGFDLIGNLTSTQSALIVPNPADSDKYYVFTVDKADDTDIPNVLRQSILCLL